MDYLDPKKQLRHTIILMVGYVLIGIAIVIGTLILLYQAYGFGLGKNGKVIQNGLFFFSSQPHPANIYVDGALKPVKTNTRLSLPAGIYDVTLARDGYRDWQRTIALDGGSVEHFDYPLLVPKTLDTSRIAAYASAPSLATQSPDRRWMLVQKPGTVKDFDIYDLKNPAKAPVALSLPDGLLAKTSGAQAWRKAVWADDNRHVLLSHISGGKLEYVLADRTDPTLSVNLNLKLSAEPSTLMMVDNKYDKYYLYDAHTRLLSKASLGEPAPQPYLDHVFSYRPYGKDTVLYVTDRGAPAHKVSLNIRSGGKVVTLRSFPAGGSYVEDLTEYSGTMYVVAGAVSENKVYIYKDPVAQLADDPGHAPVPTQVLHLKTPDYLSFSDNAQFIMAEHGAEFAVYDIENEQAYHYTSLHALDKPQTHAGWMDGDRLTYVSGGKLLIFDYDNANRQVLMPADGRYEPAFTPDYKSVYTLSPSAAKSKTNGKTVPGLDLDRTWLLTPADR